MVERERVDADDNGEEEDENDTYARLVELRRAALARGPSNDVSK